MRGSTADTFLAYVLPIVVFGAFTALEGFAPASSYPVIYGAKIAAVTVLLLTFRRPLRDIRLDRRHVVAGVVVGLVVFVAWTVLTQAIHYPGLGSRVGFNPFRRLQDPVERWAFLLTRFFGLIVVVPIMEELFLRSFLLRYLTSSDFASVPFGDFSSTAFWVVNAVCAIAHPEWIAALVASAVYTLLLRYSRSLSTTVLAHATTNCALGVYILAAGAWRLW